METFLYFLTAAVSLFCVGVGYLIGSSKSKPTTPQPAPAPQPKVFGLSEFERFVGAIPETAKSDPNTLGVVVQAGTSLAVGLLGFEDNVVQETEEAIASKLVRIRQNDERTSSLQEEISQISASISELNSDSTVAQARITNLTALKRLKSS